jgi:hypothetical protein
VTFKGRFINQLHLTKLQASQFAIPKQTAKILQAVTADLSGNLHR